MIPRIKTPMRPLRSLASAVLAAALGLAAAPGSAAELLPLSYSSLFSKARVVVSGTVTGVSSGFLSGGRKARVEVEGLYKGRLRNKDIEVSWKDEDHEETGYVDGSKVILFLVMRKDSTFAQVGPGVSCWPVEQAAFGARRPVKAVSYEFPLDLISGIPKGALRETEVVEKSLNFQVPKRKRWILVDALLPHMKPYKPPRHKVARKKPRKT